MTKVPQRPREASLRWETTRARKGAHRSRIGGSGWAKQVPLRALVDDVTKVAPLVLNHEGQFPSVTLSFNLLPGVSLGTAVAAIHQFEQRLGNPPGTLAKVTQTAERVGARARRRNHRAGL